MDQSIVWRKADGSFYLTAFTDAEKTNSETMDQYLERMIVKVQKDQTFLKGMTYFKKNSSEIEHLSEKARIDLGGNFYIDPAIETPSEILEKKKKSAVNDLKKLGVSQETIDFLMR